MMQQCVAAHFAQHTQQLQLFAAPTDQLQVHSELISCKIHCKISEERPEKLNLLTEFNRKCLFPFNSLTFIQLSQQLYKEHNSETTTSYQGFLKQLTKALPTVLSPFLLLDFHFPPFCFNALLFILAGWS